jgi:hypothetical protein
MFDARTAPSSTAEVLARLTEKDKAQKAEKADKAEAPKAKAAKAKGRGKKDLKDPVFWSKFCEKTATIEQFESKSKSKLFALEAFSAPTEKTPEPAPTSTSAATSQAPTPASTPPGAQPEFRRSFGAAPVQEKR